jgi:hypothetical protein
MNHRKTFREHVPVCPACKHKGYSWEPSPYVQDKRPLFTCGCCKNEWTAGLGGKPYIDSKFCKRKTCGITKGAVEGLI